MDEKKYLVRQATLPNPMGLDKMASSVVGSAIINAGAFTLGSWLMRQFDPSDYAEEAKRHNRALE